MAVFVQKNETYEIIGICMEVHRTQGHGFSEIIYKDAIETELRGRNIPFNREKEFCVDYKGIILPHTFFADFIVFENIVLEIKASEGGIADEHISQVLNYLKVSRCKVGLLINFGRTSLQYKRLVY